MANQMHQQQLNSALYALQRLLVNELKIVCREENLACSGIKNALQQRIRERVNRLLNDNEINAFNTLCDRIRRVAAAHGHNPVNQGYTQPYPQNHGMYPWGERFRDVPSYNHPQLNNAWSRSHVSFSNSPFYTIMEPLFPIKDLPAMVNSRNAVSATLTLSSSISNRIKADPEKSRIFLFCTSDYQSQQSEISFPTQVEVKVNEEIWAGNLRGIKKRPGTTRPADITPLVRKQNLHANIVTITYAATDRRFFFVAYMVQKHPVAELVQQINNGHVISEETVINDMLKESKDADIVTTSTIMSLKCPLSARRMTLPCRSANCSHNQCFDVESFLQLQEQAPQWLCPTCNKSVTFGSLVVDQYVQNILDSTPRSIEQVTVEPNGVWRSGLRQSPPESANTPVKAEPTDEDLIEISDFPMNGFNPKQFQTPTFTSNSISNWPQGPSSTISSAGHSSSTPGKRPADNVIDLTLSSDEDDEMPVRPIKRQSTASFVTSQNSQQRLPTRPMQESFSFEHSPDYGLVPPTQQNYQYWGS